MCLYWGTLSFIITRVNNEIQPCIHVTLSMKAIQIKVMPVAYMQSKKRGKCKTSEPELSGKEAKEFCFSVTSELRERNIINRFSPEIFLKTHL